MKKLISLITAMVLMVVTASVSYAGVVPCVEDNVSTVSTADAEVHIIQQGWGDFSVSKTWEITVDQKCTSCYIKYKVVGPSGITCTVGWYPPNSGFSDQGPDAVTGADYVTLPLGTLSPGTTYRFSMYEYGTETIGAVWMLYGAR